MPGNEPGLDRSGSSGPAGGDGANLSRLAALVAAAPGSLVLPERPRAARAGAPVPLRLLDALDLGDGRSVVVAADAAERRWTVPVVLGAAGLRRARPGDGVAAALVAALREPVARQNPAFSITAWHAEPALGERAVTADQTNESVIVGDKAVVKWAVRLPAGGEPDSPGPSRLAVLADAGFADTPRLWGLLRWQPGRADGAAGGPAGGAAGGPAVALASVTSFLPGALDGWDWAVADAQAFAQGSLARDGALAPARALGALGADLHAALATAAVGVAGPHDVQRWARRALADLDEALAVVGGPEGERLAARAPALRTAFTSLDGCAGTPLIHAHGDLHVGQVLRWPAANGGARYAVTDFDGNPVLPPAERALPAPAALDVAGMLASLDHVGRIVLHHAGKAAGSGDAAPAVPAAAAVPAPFAGAVRDWIASAQREYLASYRARLARRGETRLLDERLLWPLRLHQEIREFLYAVHHLPHWRYVPDAALLDLLPRAG